MARDVTEFGDPEDWLCHARSNLALASQRRNDDILYETLAFEAQQASEKSIKAVIMHTGMEFPHTDNIARLIKVVEKAGIVWPEELSNATDLMQYALESTYPGRAEPVSREQWAAAVTVAKSVLEWAERIISSS